MRRALPTILVTAAGLTWLLRAQGAIDNHAQAAALTTGATSDTTSNTTPDTTPDTSSNTSPDTTPTTAQPGAPTTVAGSRVVDGAVADTRWGPVQVAAVISGSRLVDVKVLEYPNERDRSVYINEQALPILHDEALQAQSAQLDGLSGATYTWDGYERSLQSALDKAGFKA